MKNINKIIALAAVTATFGLAGVASAQNDIAASPKGAQLRDHVWMVNGVTSAPSAAVVDDGIAASPRQREQINASKAVVSTPTTAVATASPADDGIAASPKYRQFLNEHQSEYQVAPLK